jgi:PadR family transcriptional regulator PadR
MCCKTILYGKEKEMIFQLGTPLLDACVLAILKKEDAYGYILTQNVKDIINISESTLYPVLRRLQNEECLTAYDKPFQGRNRRYYKITDAGEERCQMYISEWEEYKTRVDNILIGGVNVG